MGEDPRAAGSEAGSTSAGERSPEEIRADDVKGQARQRISDLKGNLDRRRQELTAKARSTTPESAQQSGRQALANVRENPAPVALGGAILAGFVLGRLTGRR